MTEGTDWVTFEQPLTEKVRTFLRLEFLFAQHQHHHADLTPAGARSTLHALLDILVVISRSDLKNEILKELTDQHAHLTRLAAKPGVDPELLKSVLAEINESVRGMQQLATQFANSLLRGNDFLTSVLSRASIPGGTCAFDLPIYHYWLSRPQELVQQDLDRWFADLRPFQQAVNLYLRLLRNSVPGLPVIARGGIYIHTPQSPCLLLRVTVPIAAGVYPEISAGKHRFTVRFMSAIDVNARAHQAATDIGFQMQCCAL